MAFKNYKLEDFSGVGQRLMELARENELMTPAEIAQALYERCYELVKPGERKNKYGKVVKSEENDIKAIIKFVQAHLNEKNAYNVQSKYMFAYSRLFECSIDYLYGITKVRSYDLDIRQICEKTGLSEHAVSNLVDHKPDDDTVAFSLSLWWSKILEDEAFYGAPLDWIKYCIMVLESQDVKKRVNAILHTSEDSEFDEIAKYLHGMRAETLIKLRSAKDDECYGALGKMIRNIENYLEKWATEWVSEQHKEFDEMFYQSEINKLKIIEAALTK